MEPNKIDEKTDKKRKEQKQSGQDVEFASKDDERINSSESDHSGNQIGGAGGNNFDSANEVKTHN